MEGLDIIMEVTRHLLLVKWPITSKQIRRQCRCPFYLIKLPSVLHYIKDLSIFTLHTTKKVSGKHSELPLCRTGFIPLTPI